MGTLILVILVISLLILVHEWGHFYSARKMGIRVDEFGFGFPPKIYSWVKNGVRYSLNLLPFGGFVKIFGEHGEGENDPQSFVSRPGWQRFIVLAAGVFMNLVLAWVFFSVASAVGVPQISEGKEHGIPVSIVGILPGSPAEKAGIKFGDEILELRSGEISLRVESEQDIRDFVDAYRGEEITLVTKRGDFVQEIKATPRANVPENEGPLGVALARLSIKRAPWYMAPIEGGKALFRSVVFTLQGLGFIVKEIFVEGKTSVPVSGPVGIFFFAQDTLTLGTAYVLQFVGMLSVNLAVLNFLPIPALDGGRIFFLAVEKIRGRQADPKFENFIHALGFVFLVILMIIVTYKDLVRIF